MKILDRLARSGLLQGAKGLVKEHHLLEFYPPFLFMGAKVKSVSDDYRSLHVVLPRRWYGTNHHGTIFGGFLCAVSDPLPSLLCSKLFPNCDVWTKTNCVDFHRPARGPLNVLVEISEADVEAITEQLEATGKATHVFEFAFRDGTGKVAADVRNTVFMRKRKRKRT